MGCAMFFVCMSLRPELNAKIDIMIGLAPASSVAESMTGLHLQAPFVNHLVVSNIKKFTNPNYSFKWTHPVILNRNSSDYLPDSWSARIRTSRFATKQFQENILRSQSFLALLPLSKPYICHRKWWISRYRRGKLMSCILLRVHGWNQTNFWFFF